MAIREGRARWEGTFRDGSGTLGFGAGQSVYSGKYSAQSRFEDGDGTNPEELIGAAHAGCFSMALSVSLAREGYTPEFIETIASVQIERVDGVQTITTIGLDCRARVAEISADEFLELATGAKENCPVSRALSAVDISLAAELLA